MLIHEINLKNIRSYEDLSLSFDEGITLLSGDIGAGKSTILQSIEFSLFGIQRGGLEGEGLLRHGTEEGLVSVLFSIDDTEVRVTRGLKRTNLGVRQTDGLLATNGSVESLTASELKARILALLGYPEQLVTKSKGLIFRHTVYTPQEDMKHIIFMPAEDRLNTLRMLFGIEKYRLIAENAQLLLKTLRAEERHLLQAAATVPSLEREQHALRTETEHTLAAVQTAEAHAKEASGALHALRREAETARQAWEAAMALDTKRALLTAKSKERTRSIALAEEDRAKIDSYLALPLTPVPDHSVHIDETRTQLDETEELLLSVTRQLAEHRGKHKHLVEHEHRITAMDACPVCEQPVTASHKHHVHETTAHEQRALDNAIVELTAREQDLRTKKAHLQAKAKELADAQRKYATYQKEAFVRADQQHQRDRLTERIATLIEERAHTDTELASLPLPDPSVAQIYQSYRARIEASELTLSNQLTLVSRERELHATKTAQLLSVTERLAHATNELARASTLQSLRVWIEEQFLELISLVERHVLASIHAEFRELFQTWFSKLIEDETIAVSLGESFEPLVSQNGYDASLEQLSGGEKTAVALSYRLALYRVVSDFISTVRTKDLLILDEPTDGFSTEQLDRVRDVLRSLPCKQIILVSHETQMESSCDHVVRIAKRLHRSSAA